MKRIDRPLIYILIISCVALLSLIYLLTKLPKSNKELGFTGSTEGVQVLGYEIIGGHWKLQSTAESGSLWFNKDGTYSDYFAGDDGLTDNNCGKYTLEGTKLITFRYKWDNKRKIWTKSFAFTQTWRIGVIGDTLMITGLGLSFGYHPDGRVEDLTQQQTSYKYVKVK